MEKEIILQTLAEWKVSIIATSGKGIFGWNNSDEKVFQYIMTTIRKRPKIYKQDFFLPYKTK